MGTSQCAHAQRAAAGWGAAAGSKYFDLRRPNALSVELSGRAEGEFFLSARPDFHTIAAR